MCTGVVPPVYQMMNYEKHKVPTVPGMVGMTLYHVKVVKQNEFMMSFSKYIHTYYIFLHIIQYMCEFNNVM